MVMMWLMNISISNFSELLKNKEDLSKEELLEVADIYARMGKEERMKMFRTFANKKKPSP